MLGHPSTWMDVVGLRHVRTIYQDPVSLAAFEFSLQAWSGGVTV